MKNKPPVYLLYALGPNRQSYYGFDANRRLHLQADISWPRLHLNGLCDNFHRTEKNDIIIIIITITHREYQLVSVIFSFRRI